MLWLSNYNYLLQEDKTYNIFHNKGIPEDMNDLWDQLFKNTVAIGKHCVVPGMTQDVGAKVADMWG